MPVFDNLFAVLPYKCPWCGRRFRWNADYQRRLHRCYRRAVRAL